ncbi:MULTISPECIES: hypothetical protein [unclassified Leptolyngbya]|uniref:hypothetical protein n=1 Tax=unclassified Leptolyngbya TaxID=2650499 RepID=UPI0016831E59|nr:MULTISPECIES: hypothetical protein [unclassified Leptolyngbya]MBD1913665.1 hypothetical protein [Leptolyngbya sp. FACHB-8]MBD2157045.1 hypothetical protein [Leptolyngbya sp. FACHB-16]
MKVLKRGYAVGRHLIGKNGDRGYAMPIAIGFGLAIMMVSAALLLRSQNDDVTANQQEATGSSLNVAESGLARIQSFINNNRSVSTYNLSAWSNSRATVSTGNLCGPTSTTDIAAFAAGARNWQNVDPASPSKGQFRVVDYTYQANDATRPNSAPGIGTLQVEGRLTNRSSINSLRVTIPVQSGDMSGVPIPGLWLNSGQTGGNTVQGNVLTNDCSVPLSAFSTTGVDPNTSEPYRAYYTTMQMPALPTMPTGNSLNSLPNNAFTGNNNDVVLPHPGAQATTKTLNNGQTVQVYEYGINNLNIPQNGSLTITPGTRVTIYLAGNISRGGDIIHNCTGVPTCRPTNFQIYGYGGTGSTICLNGNNYIDMFVLAPRYAVGVAGAGGSGGIRGAVWVNNWSNSGGCGSNTSNITVLQTADWDLMSVMPQNLPPRFSPIQTWQRQDAQP